jgi:SAM-dependent methyltransferase
VACHICGEPTRCAFERSGYAIHSCTACEFLFVHPYPTNELIANHYAAAYRGASASYYPKAGSRVWRGFWRSLKFVRHVHRRRVLDLGCGGGFMVHAFQRLGAASAEGLDISANSIAYARSRYPGLPFYCETMEAFRARGLSYDFVFSSEVLEHLPGHGEFMTTLRAIVAPGGFVYVSCPDAGHPAARPWEKWEDICPPEHLQWFNASNLEAVFRQAGFVQVWRERSRTPAHSALFRRIGWTAKVG